jgi:hypothetical protein
MPRPQPALPAAIFRLRVCCALASLAWLAAALGVWLTVAARPTAWVNSRAPALAALGPLPFVAALWAVCLSAERGLLRRVRREPLLACPVCLYPIQDRRPRCPECGAEFSRREVREVWNRAEL